MIALGLAIILALGVSAQWLAWRLRIPSILLLLVTGFLVGPIAAWITGGRLFLDIGSLFNRELLLAGISLAVGLILFEGGLTLNFAEIRSVRRGVWSLVTIGAAVTWVIAALAARLILGLDWGIAMLLGAILTVTGPTVIGPLLRFVRPTGAVGKVLKWEGIVIDPIGALLAVLVFEALRAGHEVNNLQTGASAVWTFVSGAALTSVAGSAIGLAFAFGLVWLIRRFLIPDHLQVPATLAFVAAAFAASNYFVHESGLFATTIMGIAMANQHRARIAHIIEFKETLTILLIAILFIILSARLRLEDLSQINLWSAAAFVAVLILIARPAAVFASTLGTRLHLKEKLFLSWMAPRGIVAASVASVFGLALRQEGVPQAELLTPYVFLVIVATVAIYGLSAVAVARRLGLADPANPGFIVAGATPLAREIARALQNEKVESLVVDTNYQNIQQARLAGLQTLTANILSPTVLERIELTGIGRLLALTPNDEVNSLAAVHFARHFGRSNTFQLPAEARRRHPAGGNGGSSRTEMDSEVRGRTAFGQGYTLRALEDLLAQGAQVRRTRITREFTARDWQAHHGPRAVPLLLVDENGTVDVFAADRPMTPRPGQTIISLSPAEPADTEGEREPSDGRLPAPGHRQSPRGAPAGQDTSVDSAADARQPVGVPEV